LLLVIHKKNGFDYKRKYKDVVWKEIEKNNS